MKNYLFTLLQIWGISKRNFTIIGEEIMINFGTISEKDRELFFLTDSIEDGVTKIRTAYEREEPMPNFYF